MLQLEPRFLGVAVSPEGGMVCLSGKRPVGSAVQGSESTGPLLPKRHELPMNLLPITGIQRRVRMKSQIDAL